MVSPNFKNEVLRISVSDTKHSDLQAKLSCYQTLSVVGAWHRRLSEAKVKEGMEPRRIDDAVALGHMAKQGAKRRSE